MQAIVAERGQVTIPKALRERLGIEPGTVLEFTEEGGRLVASKRIESPVEAVKGCLKHLGLRTNAVLKQLRGYK